MCKHVDCRKLRRYFLYVLPPTEGGGRLCVREDEQQNHFEFIQIKEPDCSSAAETLRAQRQRREEGETGMREQ